MRFQLLVDNRVSGLPVIDDSGSLVGVISESDLMWQTHWHRPARLHHAAG